MKKLTDDEKGIIRRAFSKHYHSLRRAADKCMGGLWPNIYLCEAERTAELLKKLLGKDEEILSLQSKAPREEPVPPPATKSATKSGPKYPKIA